VRIAEERDLVLFAQFFAQRLDSDSTFVLSGDCVHEIRRPGTPLLGHKDQAAFAALRSFSIFEFSDGSFVLWIVPLGNIPITLAVAANERYLE
jgi:hypothetical protein